MPIYRLHVYVHESIIFVYAMGSRFVFEAGFVAFNKSSVLHNAIVAANLPGTMTGLYIMFAGGLVIAVVA